jgi:hypothetical protein
MFSSHTREKIRVAQKKFRALFGTGFVSAGTCKHTKSVSHPRFVSVGGKMALTGFAPHKWFEIAILFFGL